MSADRPDPIAQPQPPSSDLSSKPDQPRASDTEQDEEERRRAGRGGGGSNPANPGHSLNIRPDVVQGPAGLEVRTTMKSADYRAEASLEADLAEAARDTREEHQEPLREQVAQRDPAAHDGAPPHPRDALEADLLAAASALDDGPQREQVAHRDTSPTHDDAPLHQRDELEADLLAAAANADDGDPQREQAYRQASEESTKRQDAERAARSGEDVPGDAASGATDSLAADIRAAEKATKLEREGEGQEEESRGQADTGQAAGKGGGRGLFLG
jgi:hypothetical protein